MAGLRWRGKPKPMRKARKKPPPPEGSEPEQPKPPAEGKRRLPPEGDPLRYVYHPRPRCPVCRGANLRTRRSTRHPDGAIERHTECRDCGQRFILVLE